MPCPGPVQPDAEHERHLRRVAGASIAITVAIVSLFVVASFWIGHELVAEPTGPALRIDVTAQRWWWDVRYHDPIPSRGIHTANEIHIPVGRPVQLTLRSVDVIHSF